MKRRDLEKHLREHGCELHHHGGRHDVWINAKTLRQTSVPRHNQLKQGTVRAICEKLDVPVAPLGGTALSGSESLKELGS